VVLRLDDQDAQDRSPSALADALAEGEQLKETVRALRGELEAREQEHQRVLQEQRRAVADDRQQLEATITALRAKLEDATADRAAAEAEVKRVHRDEMSQLESTIRELRRRLEANDGD
jgi:SMC interacting uncharacterized protein involved in chromosome segregation